MSLAKMEGQAEQRGKDRKCENPARFISLLHIVGGRHITIAPSASFSELPLKQNPSDVDEQRGSFGNAFAELF